MTFSFPGVPVSPLSRWYVQCVLVFSRGLLSSFNNKVDASNPQSLYQQCEEPPILWWPLAHFKPTNRNPWVLNILCAPSWFPFIFLHLQFCPRKLTSMDLLTPMSLLFWLGSAKGRQIIRQQDVREVTWLLFPLPTLRLDCSLAGAASPTTCHRAFQVALLLQLLAAFQWPLQTQRTPPVASFKDCLLLVPFTVATS